VLGKSLADLPWQQRALSCCCALPFSCCGRLGLVTLGALGRTHRIATVVLLDVSDSVADATLEKARASWSAVPREGHRRRGQARGVAARPRAVRVEQDDKLRCPNADLRWKDAPSAKPTEAGSNIQAALELSYGCSRRYLKRIVLFSDGSKRGQPAVEAKPRQAFWRALVRAPFRDPPPVKLPCALA